RSDHIVFFHLLTDGSCPARLTDGSEELEVTAGGLLLFPPDHPHILRTGLSLSPSPVRLGAPRRPGQGASGRGGRAAPVIYVYLACDQRACRGLLGPLPPMLRLPLGDISKSGWLADLLHLGVQGSLAKWPGSQSLLAKLSELAFIETLRR